MGHNKKKENTMKPIRVVWGVAPLILAPIARAIGFYHNEQTTASQRNGLPRVISELCATSAITESSSGVNSIGVRVASD